MRRLVVALVLALGSVTVSAPAYAAVTVSAHAGRTSFLVGSRTTISGAAYGAKPGSVVKLQRRVNGTWTTLTSKKVWSAHTYSFFGVKPPRGYQYYRVVKPAQFGQPWARSATIRLTVRWNPTLTASSTFTADPSLGLTMGQNIEIVGKVTNAPASPVVAFERKDATGWTILQKQAVTPGVQFTFAKNAPTGPSYRVRLLSTALTTQRISSTFVYAATPQTMTMNSSLVFENVGPSDGVAAIAKVPANAGDYVTVVGEEPDGAQYTGTVTAPSGQSVATFGQSPDEGQGFNSRQLVRFTAPTTGTYTISISQVSSIQPQFTLDVSTPKIVNTTMDAAAVPVSSDVPGQPVDVRFDTTGTPRFTVPTVQPTTTETDSLLDPTNTPVQPWVAANGDREPIYTSTGGVYTFRMEADGTNGYVSLSNGDTAQALSVTTVDGTVDGPDTNAVIDVPQRVVLVQFARPAQHVTVGYDSNTYDATVATFDANTGQPDPAGTGTSVVAVAAHRDETYTVPIQLSTPYAISSTVDGSATSVDLNPSYKREIAIHFHATAGQIVAPDVTTSQPTYWQDQSLTGPDGSTIPELHGSPDLWNIPTDGDYTLTLVAWGNWQGAVGVKSAETTTIPGDGTPTTITIDKPGAVIVAKVPMPAGNTVDATLDQIDPNLGNTWSASVYTPAATWPTDTAWFDSWATAGVLPPIVVPQPGDILAIISAQQTGTLRLTFTPRS